MHEAYPDPSFNSRLIEPQELPWTYTFKVKTPPTAQAVTLEDVKTFARLDGVDEDRLIELFIQGASQAAEEYLGRAIMQQTLVLKMDFFPGIIALLPRYLATSASPVPLPRPPLVTVSAVRTLYEDDSVIENWNMSNYYWLTGDAGLFVIRKGAVPPINVERYRGGFEIEYVSGYGAIGDSVAAQRNAVPAPIKLGLMLWAASLYASRGIARGGATEPPPEAKSLLDPYKFQRV